MYRLLFERVLSRFDAETMHHVGSRLLAMVLCLPWLRRQVRSVLAPRDPTLTVRAFGRVFDSPVGLAAGFDKDATGFEALYALGFAFIEVGTITGEPQPGNPKPRLFRLTADRALINRFGFNNVGAAAVAERLRGRPDLPLGVNLGKTKTVAEAEAGVDYAKSAELLASHADYVVINVSSPNTPGLRNLQAVDALEPLILTVRAALDRGCPGRRVPLLVKIAPDLEDEDIDAVADLAVRLDVDGLVATNTTIARAGLTADPDFVEALGPGGLSGAPLAQRSLVVLRRLRARVGERLLLVSVGGISSAEDVLERILAGATLVQAYTAFVFGGPLWPARLRRQLSALVRRRGFGNVTQAIGAGARSLRPPASATPPGVGLRAPVTDGDPASASEGEGPQGSTG